MHNVLRLIGLVALLLGVTLALAREPISIYACRLEDPDAARFSLVTDEAIPGTLYVRPAAVGDWPPDLPAGVTVLVIPFDADGVAVVEYATEAGEVYSLAVYRDELNICADPVSVGDAPAIPIPVGGPGQYAIWFPDAFGTLTDSGVIVDAELKDGAWAAVIVLGDRSLVGQAFEARRVE